MVVRFNLEFSLKKGEQLFVRYLTRVVKDRIYVLLSKLTEDNRVYFELHAVYLDSKRKEKVISDTRTVNEFFQLVKALEEDTGELIALGEEVVQ